MTYDRFLRSSLTEAMVYIFLVGVQLLLLVTKNTFVPL